ncbi:aminotransferase class I/II-fold pyridoxal phosphate-dependent enzyme [Candidatus Woesearchaeota archaeon]|nr:aminotransferase class I/II-fold pyridoxal phosphate-dependent enzyme [Candidatus Woesearchaeota archaeon]
MNWKIPLFKTYSDKNDIITISEIIKRGTYWASGPEINEFEKKLANFVGTKYALAFNSGTSALHTILLAYNIRGKEVIVPSFTFIATANAVILAGGKPVFAETEFDTFGLDAEDVKKRINKNTKAIIPLHYGGFPSRDIQKLRKIADKNNIFLIEDAAESLGANINDKKVGTFGDSSMFSFCQNKVITTGEGGLIVTNSEEVYEKSKIIRSHGRVELNEDYFSSSKDNDYIQVGYNFRMPTMCAALGLAQFNKIEKLIEKRRQKARYLDKELSKIKQIKLLKKLDKHYQVYQMYSIKLENEKIRNDLQNYLIKKGIMNKIYFKPVHLKTYYKKLFNFKKGDLPNTEKLSKRVLTLPFYPDISEKELKYIKDSINEFFS